MMNDCARLATANGHLQGGQDQLNAQMYRECSSDYPTAPRVQDDGNIQEAGPSGHVGDVSYPELIGTLSPKVPFDQIRGHRCGAIAYGGRGPLAPTHAPQALFTHQACYTLASYVLPTG
jgi:hypothetical protein